MNLFLESGAALSECGQYRYRLTRIWDSGTPPVCWVMLNPSTADASQDDPTIRRCMAFAREWEAGGILVVNLFAFRATDPAALRRAKGPVGPLNDEHLEAAASLANGFVVAGWGAHGNYLRRDRQVLTLLRIYGVQVKCLGVTRDGHPRHPLYVKSGTALVPLRETNP